MRERGRRSRVGQVIGRHVNRLYRGDRALLGRGDALLQRAHLGCQRRLIAYGGRHTAEQRGYLGAGLREAEDVVDEQQHVLTLDIAEILRHRQAGKCHAHTRSRRLVHLAVNQRGLVDNAGFLHLVVQIVALTGTLADAGEYGDTAVLLCDVVDQLHDENGLADACAAEQTDLAALGDTARSGQRP